MAEHEQKNPLISDPSVWVERHGDPLYRYAILRVKEPVIAEDLVQETFLAALKSRHSFAGRSAERTWFIGILKRKIVDYFRKSDREVALEDEHVLVDQPDADFLSSGPLQGHWQPERAPMNWQIDPADTAEQKEFWQYLQTCLGDLPERMARAFVLREVEEISSTEICNALKVQPTNLRVMLHRARKLIRRCLEKNWLGLTKGVKKNAG